MTEEFTGRGRRSRAENVQSRAEALPEQRRRRKGHLDYARAMKLDVFSEEQLDLENWTYRWVNDSTGRIYQMTVNDDWEFVRPDEINNFGAMGVATEGSEGDERISRIVGSNPENPNSPMRAYLLKKPRDWYEADAEELVRERNAKLRGDVLNAKFTAPADVESKAVDGGKSYVPKGVGIKTVDVRSGVV